MQTVIQLQAEVIYDIYQKLHAANGSSAEKPERINEIIKHFQKNETLSKIIFKYEKQFNCDKFDWSKKITNCTACTYILKNDKCDMCYSKQTHKWMYVNDVDGDTTYQTPFTNEIIKRASEIISIGINKLIYENKKFVFCLTRPPGHHSCENKRVGFCHKNFAIEAMDILFKLGKSTVILDIDAHHGDGSEIELLKRDYGYYISIHGFGDNIYPGTGKLMESQKILNIPLDKNADDFIWFNSFDKFVLPKILYIKPDIIILSCGFDGYYKDLIAPLQLTENFYKILGKKLSDFNIPILSILEGGYYVPDLGILCEHIIKPFVI